LESDQQKRNLSVQEQNALQKRKILDLTRRLYDPQSDLAPLKNLCSEFTALGVLVGLSSVPEQEGDYVSGLWLSPDQRFFSLS
jgi:hypothetical protein